jgi:hypothetical protein
MKSLERRFQNITEKSPSSSSYICFAKAVKGQNFNKQTIHRWFQKLVDKDDYERSEKKAILAHLDNLSSPPRTTKNTGKTTPQSIILSETE